ncbi:regulatory protein RecX [Sanguibacter suaedae]|uniref:Regulatory protein RecX n=1 Tax=Sanguibacter suaedae TaxID=2795737 RepID=A0A934IB78_9MICO|nr:regulatory protein RecX [Sanguibacter suaedae]MBI9115505.1 RecX family transcriptional regulator [Sanguibacter suaedae]
MAPHEPRPTARPGEEDGRSGAPSPREPTELEQEEAARAVALRALAAAPRSRAQLEETLLRRGTDADLAARLLDRFEEVGLVDDAELAAMIVRTRFAEKKQARRAIAHELARKGIAPHLAQDALEQLDGDDEEEAAVELAASRLRRTSGLPEEVRVRRALGALGRKGYSGDVAMRAVRAALDAESSAVGVLPEP